MSDCKSALVEAEGDMEKAVEIILKKGLAKSAKRAGAVATEGEVAPRSSRRRASSGVIVEVNSQTDFAARSDDFKQFVGDVARRSREGAKTRRRPRRASTLGRQDGRRDVARSSSRKIGENIAVRRWDALESPTASTASRTRTCTWAARSASSSRSRPRPTPRRKHAEFEKFVDDTRDADRRDEPARRSAASEVTAGRRSTKQKRDLRGAARAKIPSRSPRRRGRRSSRARSTSGTTEIALLEQESVVVPGKTIEQAARRGRQGRGRRA